MTLSELINNCTCNYHVANIFLPACKQGGLKIELHIAWNLRRKNLPLFVTILCLTIKENFTKTGFYTNENA